MNTPSTPASAAARIPTPGRRSLLPLYAAGFVTAFGAHAGLLKPVIVYLGGSAVASVSPTPGALGAVEAALVAGLTGVGIAAGPAVAGVLAFRLVTFWAPTLPGFFALRAVRSRQWV